MNRRHFTTDSERVAAALLAQQDRLGAILPMLGEARPADIHEARVTARRLRSLLKTYRPVLDRQSSRLCRLDLKSFARALGGQREADVRAALLRELARELGLPELFRRRLVSLLRRDREAARRDFRARARRPEWQALEAALTRGPRGDRLLEDREMKPGAALALARRPWRKARRLLARRGRSAAELHELRLALKHCRYAVESVSDLAPQESARLLRRLRRAQDAIGGHRDVLQATEWVRSRHQELGDEPSRKLRAGLGQREKALRREALERSARVAKAHTRWLKALGKYRAAAAAGSAGRKAGPVSVRKTAAQSRSR